MKIPRGASKSLNYASKKREAERIDRENQKILTRIINVKANKNVEIAKLKNDFRNGHMKNRRMLQNTGVQMEDLLDLKRFRNNISQGRQGQLPRIMPGSSMSQ